MIPVLMDRRGYTLQEAVDYVGELCRQCIERFEEQRHQLPSWGPELDADVEKYVLGLQHWIVGSLHWSFDSERYFGKTGLEVKRTRIVNLLPKRPLTAEEKQELKKMEDDKRMADDLFEIKEEPRWIMPMQQDDLKRDKHALPELARFDLLGRFERALLARWLRSQKY
jgi:hypothetical protein